MNKDYTPFNHKFWLLLICCWSVSQVSLAQVQLTLDNDTRANDRYCDADGQVFIGCGATYQDNGGNSLYSDDIIDRAAQNSPANDYGDDDFEPIFWTFCPDNPTTKRIKLTFTEFDIHASDNFYVYDGDCSLANGDIDPDVGVDGLDDNNALDPNNYIQFAGNSPGQMTQIGGTGTVNFGTGWIEASCTNVSGCITIGWNPNGDDNKGTGWTFNTTCTPRLAEISCPNGGDFPFDDLTIGCQLNVVLPVPPATLSGCAGTDTTLLAPPYIIQVLIDGVSLGFIGGDLSAYPSMRVGVGRHTATYRLFFDKDGDGDAFDEQLVELQAVNCVFTIFDADDLVCPADVNISLGDDCATVLQPKEIIDQICAPAYPLRIVIGGQTYTANCRDCDFLDRNGQPLALTEGSFEYIIRDNCNNACFGEINLKDIQVPQCVGPNFVGVLCTDPIPNDPPIFLDCNEIVQTTFTEQEFGACGLFSEAEVTELEDIISPTFFNEIAPNISVLTGSGFTAIDIRPDVAVTFESITVRRYRVTDSNGNTNEDCPQVFINVRSDTLMNPNLPAIEVKCGESITPTALLNLKNADGTPRFLPQNIAPWFNVPIPKVPNDTINVILPSDVTNCHYATFYEDQLIQTIGSTQKISRTWTTLDWCAANPTRIPPFVQIIKIIDDQEPVLTAGPDTMRVSVDLFDCEVSETNLLGAAWADDCGKIVSNRTELRSRRPNGDIGVVLQSNTQNGGRFTDLAVGCYYVLYYAADEDGNETTSFGTATNPFAPVSGNVQVSVLCVVDGVKPQTRCINQLNIALRSSQDRITAEEFDAGSSDNCGIASLRVSLVDEIDKYGDFVQIGCADIGRNLRIYLEATDVNGNRNVCWGDVRILNHEDNNACGTGNQISVSGELINNNGEFLEPVTIVTSSEGKADVITSANDGRYNLSLPADADYTITPQKNLNPANGVSTYDLILISQHILKIKPFESPYQYIAADVNKSGTVTIFDMLQLRQLILRVIDDFPDNDSWRFIDATHNFGSDVSSTLVQKFKESAEVKVTDNQRFTSDFVGIKIGDINGNAVPNTLLAAEPRATSTKTVSITAADRFVEKGEQFAVDFYSENESLIGLQFSLDYKGLTLIKVEEGVVAKEHLNTTKNNKILTAWNGEMPQKGRLFTAHFKAEKSGYLSEFLSLDTSILQAEGYDNQLQSLALDLVIEKSIERANFALFQNQPNPTNGRTTIAFTLPKAGLFSFRIMDYSGQQIYEMQGEGNQGNNQIEIATKKLNATGLLFYQLQAGGFSAVRKMMVVR